MSGDTRVVSLKALPWRAFRCKNSKCGFSKRQRKIVRNPLIVGVCKVVVGVITCRRCGYLSEFYGSDDGDVIPDDMLDRYKLISEKDLSEVV